MRRSAAEGFATPPATESLRACLSLRLHGGLHGRQHLTERYSRETRGVVSQTVRDNQFALVEQSAASVNNVGHVAFPFVLVGLEQRLAKAADHFAGIVAIQ